MTSGAGEDTPVGDRLRKPVTAGAFVLLIAVGLLTFRDFGVSWDEPDYYRYGEMTRHFYASGDRSFEELVWRAYGPAVPLLHAVVVDVLEGLGADDAVEGAIDERQLFAGCLEPVHASADVAVAAHDLEQEAADAQVVAREVCAEDDAGRLRQFEDVAAGATAEVDDAVAGADVEQRRVDRLEAVEGHRQASRAGMADAAAAPLRERVSLGPGRLRP